MHPAIQKTDVSSTHSFNPQNVNFRSRLQWQPFPKRALPWNIPFQKERTCPASPIVCSFSCQVEVYLNLTRGNDVSSVRIGSFFVFLDIFDKK